jgi:NADH-quinone oxidoreductase subunit L
MGGLRKYMPVTFATMAAGWLAISGFPLLSGFFSKDEILWKTWSSDTVGTAGAGKILWVVGIVTAGLTAVYMTRLMVMTFWGAERFRDAHAGGQADEAHAHAHDEGEKPHDARLASAGDRPHHAPGEKADAPHAHEAGTHGGAHHADAHGSHHLAEDFADEEEEHEEHHHGPVEPHESPWVMTVPLVVLALLSVVGGWVGIPYALSGGAVTNYFEQTLEPVVERAPERGDAAAHGGGGAATHAAGATAEGPAAHGNEGAVPQSVGEGEAGRGAPAGHGAGAAPSEHAHDPAEVAQERLFTGISIAVGLVGIGLGWALFGKRPLLKLPRLLENKYYVDEIYDAAVIEPIKSGSRGVLWRFLDVSVIDGFVNGVGRGTAALGGVLRHLQAGFVRSYAAIILLGALAVVGYFAWNAWQLAR